MHFIRSLALATCLLLSACSLDITLPMLDTRGSVTGALDTQGHAPPSGIEVVLVNSAGSRVTQTTNDTGAFTFAELGPGSYYLDIKRDGFAPLIVPAIQVERGQSVDVGTLVLTWLAGTPSESTVLGNVVTASGTSAEGAQVELILQQAMQRVAVASVLADGTFTQRVPPGRYMLRASHPFYVSAERRDVDVPAGASLDLTAMPLTLQLNPATLTGRVQLEIDGNSTPAAGAQVTVTLDSGETTTADTMGNFMFSSLAPGGRDVHFTLANYAEHTARVTLEPGKTTTLSNVIMSLKRGVIQGSVRLNDQQPAQDVTVAITGTSYTAVATPDATQPGRGTFRISGVPNGTYEVTATKNRYSRAVQGSVQLTDSVSVVDIGPLVLTVLIGDFRIDDGDALSIEGFARTQSVILQLAAFVAAGADEYRASEDSTFASEAFKPFTTANQAFTLSSTEGRHTVYAQYRRQGTTSTVFESSIVLDTLAPTSPSVVINGGDTFTNFAQSVALELNALDPATGSTEISGLGTMRINLSGATQAIDAGTVLTGSPVTFASNLTLGLPQPQVDGPISVFAQFIDNAGNASAIVSGSITLDRVAPQHPTLSIHDGANATATGFTNNPFVQLDHAADTEPDGGFVRIKLSNSSTALSAAVYQPLAGSSSWFLDPTGADLKTVFARMIDAAGNETTVLQAQITYDITPPSPVTVTLLSRSPTNDAGVTLQLAATDTNGLSPTAAVTVAEDPLFTRDAVGPMAMPGNNRVVYQVASNDGTHQVLVRFTDKAGNSASASVSVVLDTVPPAASFTLTGRRSDNTPSSTDTSTNQVTVALTAPDATEMVVGNELMVACPSGGYVPASASFTHTLSGSATPRVVRICVRDAAGNVTGPLQQNISYDTTAPTGCALSLTGARASGSGAPPAGKTAKETISASVACSGETPTEMVVVPSAVTCSAIALLDWRSFNTLTAVTLAGPDGAYTVNGCVRDAARNVATITSASITLDTTPPSGTRLLLDQNNEVSAQYVNAATVTTRGARRVNAEGRATGAIEWALSLGADFSAATWQAFPSTSPQLSPTFPATGLQTLYAAFRDDVGNVAPVTLASITFDEALPANGSISIVTPSGNSMTNSVSVVVSINAPADAVQMALAETATSCGSATFSGVTRRPVTNNVTFLLTSTPGLKTLCAQFIDAADNVSATPASASVTLDTSPPTVAADLLVGAQTNPSATRLSSITVGLTVSADATQYALFPTPQQCAQLSTAQWANLAAGPYPFTLSGTGDPASTQSVFVCVRDAAGNTASTARSIIYDTHASTDARLTLGNGAAIQTGSSLTALFDNVDSDVTQMLLAVGAAPNCGTATYVAFQTSSSLSLADGTRQVYACLRDAAGNSSSIGPVSVTVDNAVPTVASIALSGLSNQAAGVTNNFALTVAFASIADGASGVDSLRVSTDPTFAGSPFVAAQAGGGVVTGALNYPFVLPPGDGNKIVYAQVRDRAGFVSAPVQANVTLDTQPPTWVQTDATKLYVNTGTGAFTLRATDNLDAQAQLLLGAAFIATGCATASLSAFNASFTFGPLVDGVNTVHLCLSDRAGNRPPVPPAVNIVKFSAAPDSTKLVPNSPIALASGALLSWTDTNAYTERIEIDASPDPTFATSTRTYQVASGQCAAGGVTPPPSSARVGLQPGDQPLTNLTNWYFRLRAIDCAGAASTNVIISDSVVPNVGPIPLNESFANGVIYSNGNDVWVHAPEVSLFGVGRYEHVRHCRVGVADCRNANNWATTVVPIFTGSVTSATQRAAMFATDDGVFLAETMETPAYGATVVVSSCDRTLNCDVASNWLADRVVRSSYNGVRYFAAVGAASSAALGLFFVAKDPNYGDASYLSMVRCARSRGSDCRIQQSSWTSVETPIIIDESQPLTVSASDNQFFIGATSLMAYGAHFQGPTIPDTGPSAAGQPMLIKCEGLCSSGGDNVQAGCNGGTSWPPVAAAPACNCDGQTCGDFRFSRFTQAALGEILSAASPTIVSASGQKTAVWPERRCVGSTCTEAVRARTCMTSDCLYARDYAGTGLIAQWSTTTAAAVTRIGASISGSQEVNETVRVAYTDTNTNTGWLASCTTAAGTPCFDNDLSKVRITRSDESLSNSIAAIGKDVFVLGSRALGERVVWQPLVTTPSQFVVGPRVGTLEATWGANIASSSSLLRHSLVGGASPSTITVADPFTTSVTVPTVVGREASISFMSSNGIGDPGRTWTSVPFKSYAGVANDLSGTKGISITSAGSAGVGSNSYVYAAYVSAAGLVIRACNSTSDCSVGANWDSGFIDTGAGFDSVQIVAEYPREFAHGVSAGHVSSTTPRLYVQSVKSGVLYVYTCVLTTPTACLSPAAFGAGADLSSSPGIKPTLRASGDRVQITEVDPSGFGNQITVRYCDGSHTYPHTTVCDSFTPNSTDRALDYCKNKANWQSVTLNGSIYGAQPNSQAQIAGAPHPVYGYMAVQPRQTGFIMWTCSYGLQSCSAPQNDCSNASNWVATIVDTGASVDYADITTSAGEYFPTRGMSEQTSGVYVTSFDSARSTWNIAQCKGQPAADFRPWLCTSTTGAFGASRALAWSSGVVMQGPPGTAVSSTIRVIGGDLIALFAMSDRTFVARCSGGFDCTRRSSWNTYALGSASLTANGRGLLTGGINGDMFIGYGQGLTPTFLSGGQFTSK